MPILVPGDVHVWTAHVNPAEMTQAPEDSLSPEELETARRFLFEKHRTAYVFTHFTLRDILGQYLDRPARDLRFERGPFGKPFLVDGGAKTTLHFNLSHSGGLGLVALACDRRIGIDVEEVRPLENLAQIAMDNFSPDECALVLRHHPADREQAFYRCWTRKESYIKAIGRGMSAPLNSFDTSIATGEPVRLMPQAEDPPHGEFWYVADLEVPAGYMGAVTVERGFARISYAQWPCDRRAT